MPIQGRTVASGYPVLPFYVNDHGQDALLNVTIASGAGILAGGTVLGKRTTTGLYAAYNNGNSDGSEVAAGILMNRTDAATGNALASMMLHGVVRSGSLFGLDPNGRTDLAAKFTFV